MYDCSCLISVATSWALIYVRYFISPFTYHTKNQWMLIVPLWRLATYQHIAQQDWYQYQEDNPENEGGWWKGNFIPTLLLVEHLIIVQFSNCHGHHLHNSTPRIGECIALGNEWKQKLAQLCSKLHTGSIRQGSIKIVYTMQCEHIQIFNYHQWLGWWHISTSS